MTGLTEREIELLGNAGVGFFVLVMVGFVFALIVLLMKETEP